MTPEDFQATLDTGLPFRVCLTNGKTYDVLDPMTVHVGSDVVLVGVYGPASSFPRWTMIALVNIATIEPLTPAQLS